MLNVNKLKSSQLDSAIYGMILGDGCCDRGGGNFTKNSNYTLKINHSKKQAEYLLWKRNIIDQVSHTNTKFNTYSNSVSLTTRALKYFTKLEKIFYTDRVKKITPKILSKINILSLAIWFMDDGYMSLNKSGSVYGELCTDCFSYDEHIELVKLFKTKFNMDVGIRRLEYKSGKNKGKVNYRIKFNKENCIKLTSLIRPYVEQVECMKYKLKV